MLFTSDIYVLRAIKITYTGHWKCHLLAYIPILNTNANQNSTTRSPSVCFHVAAVIVTENHWNCLMQRLCPLLQLHSLGPDLPGPPRITCSPPPHTHNVSLALVCVVVDVNLLAPVPIAGLGFALVRAGDHAVAAAGNLVHPDDVEHVQADAGDNPSHLRARAQPLERRRAERGEHAHPVGRHDGDAHQEEHHSHGNAVGHHQPVGTRVVEDLVEPPTQGRERHTHT